MSGRLSRQYADWIASHSKVVIVVVLAVTAVVAGGAAISDPGDAGLGEFSVDSPETAAADFIQSNYSSDEGVVAQIVVRNESGDVLTRESLLEGLYLQQAVRNDTELNATLAERGFVGIENVVATAAVNADRDGGAPPTGQPALEDQIGALEDRNASEVEALLGRILDPDANVLGDQDPDA
jgi:predicted RND superfamily exporter protein